MEEKVTDIGDQIPKAETAMMRLRKFVDWLRREGMCRSEFDFERQCRLTPRYISNNTSNAKGNIGSEMLGRIVRVFPQLNLAWICTGEGAMLNQGGGEFNADYRQAYEAAMIQIEALNRILKSKG